MFPEITIIQVAGVHHCLHFLFQVVCVTVIGGIYSDIEAVTERCSVKKVSLKILQSSQVFSCQFFESFMNTFCYGAPPVGASGGRIRKILKNLIMIPGLYSYFPHKISLVNVNKSTVL